MKGIVRKMYDTVFPVFLVACWVTFLMFVSFGAAWWSVGWVLKLIGVIA